jgi:hypothetical protein
MYYPRIDLTDEEIRELGITCPHLIKGIYTEDTFDRTGVFFGFNRFRGLVRPIYLVWNI